jgi:asparagine synthase (glutamine-hydrolysing)
MGFPVPFAQWMRGGWQNVAADVLLDRRTRERGLVNAPAVAALLRAHGEGRRNGGDAIWALLNLELWYRTFIDGAGVQTLPAPAPRPTATLAPAPHQPHAAASAPARIASQRTEG